MQAERLLRVQAQQPGVSRLRWAVPRVRHVKVRSLRLPRCCPLPGAPCCRGCNRARLPVPPTHSLHT